MAVQAPRRPIGNLPADATSFIGRRQELSEARRLLVGARLLTLVGVGGVGKTRLALRAAHEMRRAFEDGVWLVELAPLEDGELLAQTVAASLGLTDRSAESPMDLLLDFAADKRFLLVLDNCEHLLDAAAKLVSELLRAAAGVRVLATSRQPLGVGGECLFNVPPLSTPDHGQPISAGGFDEYEAMRLFVERAASAVPGFAVTAHNRQTVVQLCQRLDGIPLAIELAVVRLRSLSAEQLLDRLDDRFRLLTGGGRGALPRQQTMRAAIDWSYELCSAWERTLWGRVSVFSGGFDLQSVEAVCCDDAISSENVVDLVAGLVDKSVLVREEGGACARYRLLETIRQYGRKLLADSGQEEVLLRRHRDYCRWIALRTEEAWFGPDQMSWYTRLRREHANVRAALRFCLDQGDAREVFEIVSANWDYWTFYGILGEARHWLDRALEQDKEPTAARAKALWVAAHSALLQGDVATALSRTRECDALARQLGDGSAIAHATGHFGMAALFQGDHTKAVTLLGEALDLHRTARDDPGTCWIALYRLTMALFAHGDSDRAKILGEEALLITETYGAGAYRSLALWVLGLGYHRCGDLGHATAVLSGSLELQRSIKNLWHIAVDMEVLAWIAEAEGRYDYSAQLLGAVHRLCRSMGTSIPTLSPFVEFHDICESHLRQELRGEVFALAFQRGADRTFDQAITYALNEKSEAAPQSRQTPDSRPVLSRRELQVAELVAQGMTNKDIAATLVIAQRTAEGHVEHILAKLGFTSRSQVAAWAAKQGER